MNRSEIAVPWASLKKFDADQISGDYIVISKYEDKIERWSHDAKWLWRTHLFGGQSLVLRDMRGRKIDVSIPGEKTSARWFDIVW